MLSKNKIHFIGIGGIGMSAVAKLYLQYGYDVQGSDVKSNQNTAQIVKLNGKVYLQHQASNIDNTIKTIVISSAIERSNVELLRGRQLGIEVITRAEAIARHFAKFRDIVSVTGTHGKTTVTAMVAAALDKRQPTVLNGGIIQSQQSNFVSGRQNTLVLEADESDGSFEVLRGDINIITNLEGDHLDHYGSMKKLLQRMQEFITFTLQNGQTIIMCGDDQRLAELQICQDKQLFTYGYKDGNDFVVKNIAQSKRGLHWQISHRERCYELAIPCYGHHNALNATAAAVAAQQLGVSWSDIAKELVNFKGVDCRFTTYQLQLNERHIALVRDYAHHPTEIEALLAMARQWQSYQPIYNGEIHLIMQPHKEERLHDCFADFVRVLQRLSNVVRIVLLAVYNPVKTVYNSVKIQLTSHDLLNELQDASAIFIKNEDIDEYVINNSKHGDIVIFAGAGNIQEYAKEIVMKYEKKQI